MKQNMLDENRVRLVKLVGEIFPIYLFLMKMAFLLQK